jgi:GNAT superfamily N-acetyltransferase
MQSGLIDKNHKIWINEYYIELEVVLELFIRDIEEKDYLALIPLWSQFGEIIKKDKIGQHYDRMKGDDRYKTYIALINDEVVGFITSVQYFSIGIDGSFMIIIGIAVKNELQNKGIGTKLIKKMEKYAIEKEVFSIYLNSDIKRTDAHAFYEQNGYDKGSYGFGKNIIE